MDCCSSRAWPRPKRSRGHDCGSIFMPRPLGGGVPRCIVLLLFGFTAIDPRVRLACDGSNESKTVTPWVRSNVIMAYVLFDHYGPFGLARWSKPRPRGLG